MKKMLLIAIFAILGLATIVSANEGVQVFKTNTMHLEINKDTKIEKVFVGTLNDFYEKGQETISNSPSFKQAAIGASLAATAGIAANMGNTSNIDSNGGLAGAAAVITVVGAIKAYDYITEDNKYLYVATGTNLDGKTTLIYSLIVSNYSLDLNEVETLALAKLK